MRILFVASNIECPGANGGSTHVTEVVQHLRETDDVLLIARKDSSLPQTLAVGGPTAKKGLRQVNAARLALQTYAEAKRFAPDVIYERASSFGLGALLGRALSVPTLCMVLDVHRTRLSLRTASRIIATREDVVPERYRNKLRLTRWGANTRMFHPGLDGSALRARLGIPADKQVVAYTGAFYTWHGLEELVAAADALRELSVVFLLVGDGERHSAIRELVEKAGLTDRFVFTGRVPYNEVPQYIALCDVYAAPYNPSRHKYAGESKEFVYDPLKLFESMACGKAVVTVRSQNIEAMFEDGRELLLVEPGNAQDLASKLRTLLADAALRTRLGTAARAAVEAKFSWQAHVEQLRGLFAEMIAERAR